MSVKREQFELMEREARTQHGDKLSDAMFDDLLNKVREYAAKRRLEANFRKTRGDPMDVGQVKEHEFDWHGTEWYQEDNIDALGKGKSKGKGLGKAKGKGKGACLVAESTDT